MKRILIGLLSLLLCGAALANTCPILTAGATSQSVNVTFIDNTTGLPVAGLAFNSSGIDINYTRAGAAQTAVTEATQTAAGAFSSGGFVSNGQGTYRFDIPNAAIATGVPYVTVTGVITGYTMLPCTVLLSPKVDVDTIKTNPVVNGGTLTFPSGATLASTTNITAGTIATVTNLTNAPTSGDFTATMKTSIGTAVAASAVASVTGNVGGNVTGSVGTIASAGISEASYACTAGSFKALGIIDCGTAQSATGTTLVLRSALAMADDTAIGMTLVVCGSTQGYCQSRAVTDYVSSSDTATVETWTVTPSGTITYFLYGTAPGSAGGGLDAAGVRAAIGMSSANLDTQLSTIDDFVDTEVAAIKTKTDFLPSATAGATGGVFIAGTNAATTITTGLTTTFTGNLSGSVGSVASGGINEAAFATTAGSFAPLKIVDQGTAQSATGTTLVLRAAAAFANTELVGNQLLITGGSAGVGQTRTITGYVGSTDTATVDTWTTTPTGTITYKVISAVSPSTGGSGLDAAGTRAALGMTSANLDTQLAGIQSDTDDVQTRLPAALTGGGNMKSDALALSGDTTAADNAESFFDGTGYAGTNNVIPLVTVTTTATTATNLTNAPTTGDLTATMKTSVQTAAAAANASYDAPTKAELDTGFAALLTSQQIIVGTCSSGSTTTCVDAALTQAAASQLESRLICFNDSWCGLITTFTPASDTVTTTKIAPSTRASKTYTIFPSTLD